jgi:hypothetical protein
VRAELVPQLCLLLYRSSQQGSDALGSTVEWMKAHHAVSTWALLVLLLWGACCLLVLVLWLCSVQVNSYPPMALQ